MTEYPKINVEKHLKPMPDDLVKAIDEISILHNRNEEVGKSIYVQSLIEFFKDKFIGRNISETIMDADKSKIIGIDYAEHSRKFVIKDALGKSIFLSIEEIYNLSENGGLSWEDTNDRIALYLMK